MKIGIIEVGNVGCACAMAAVIRGSAREIVLVNRTRKTAQAVATDICYGIPLGRKVAIADAPASPKCWSRRYRMRSAAASRKARQR